jgi:hypothetical protein
MNPKPKPILLGGHCKSCIDVIEAESKFTIAGILDVDDNKYMKSLDKSLNLLPSNYNLISHYTTRLM